MWANGKQHGEGKFYNAKGKSKRGLWEDGERIKWLDKKDVSSRGKKSDNTTKATPNKNNAASNSD